MHASVSVCACMRVYVLLFVCVHSQARTQGVCANPIFTEKFYFHFTKYVVSAII